MCKIIGYILIYLSDQAYLKISIFFFFFFLFFSSFFFFFFNPVKVHATDYSNASGTAIYDPFIEDWSSILTSMLSLPKSIFPELRDSVGKWCTCSSELFGASIPVTAVVNIFFPVLFTQIHH